MCNIYMVSPCQVGIFSPLSNLEEGRRRFTSLGNTFYGVGVRYQAGSNNRSSYHSENSHIHLIQMLALYILGKP